MDIYNYGIHTRVLTLSDPRAYYLRSNSEHHFIWIFNQLVCYIGPLGHRIFKPSISKNGLHWYRRIAKDGNYPDIRTLRKQAEVVTDPKRVNDFFKGLYYELSKDFIKEQLLR